MARTSGIVVCFSVLQKVVYISHRIKIILNYYTHDASTGDSTGAGIPGMGKSLPGGGTKCLSELGAGADFARQFSREMPEHRQAERKLAKLTMRK